MKITQIKKTESHTHDWVIYVDTDSVFLSAVPLIRKRYPAIHIDDEVTMCDKISGVATEIQRYINDSYDLLATKVYNIKSHRFEIKQENIARRGIWVAKKRYVQKIIWENGVTKSRVDVKGLDVKRSDFPKAFKIFMSGILDDLLDGVGKDVVDVKINTFKSGLKNMPLLDICKPTGVKGLTKYKGNGQFGNTAKGTPAHVKAAIYYNDLIKLKKLNKKYPPIKNGEKIVWIYLKDNSYGLRSMGIKGSGDPDIIVEFINSYMDSDKMFSSILENKLDDFYSALNWDSYKHVNKTASQFFSF